MARGSRLPLDCCERARGSVSWQRSLRTGAVRRWSPHGGREGRDGGHVRSGRRSGCRQGDGDGVPAYAGSERPAACGDANIQDDDWVVAHYAGQAGVTIAAMESTSTYWKAPFYCLEEVMEVWLLNAAHMKAVPGRKSDVRDAEWIAQLLEHGLLRPSFVPPPEIRRLRMLTRYRVQLMGDRRRDIVRLELMLEDASIKLSSVASSLKTVSARAMLTAMINGESDPLRLADMAKGRMRGKIPGLAQALTGHFDANHARLARSMLRRLDLVEQALVELDAVIVAACRPWQHQIELLQTIPGVGPKVAETIVAETGADMTRFPSAAHLAAWAGVAPAMNESAGRQTPAGKRHGNKWLTAMLVEAAGSVGRMHGKNYLAVQHARLTKRRGMGRAQVAVAHSILVAAYWMLKRDEPYHDLGADWHSRRNDEAHTRRLIAQLEHLGHTVTLDSAA